MGRVCDAVCSGADCICTPKSVEDIVREDMARKEAGRLAEEARQQERRAAEEAAVLAMHQQLLEEKLPIVKSESQQALTRLEAQGWRDGTIIQVTVGYEPILSRFLRRPIGIKPVTEELAGWKIIVASRRRPLYLCRNGIIYEEMECLDKLGGQWFSASGYYAIDLGLLGAPHDHDDVRHAIDELIYQLRLLGT